MFSSLLDTIKTSIVNPMLDEESNNETKHVLNNELLIKNKLEDIKEFDKVTIYVLELHEGKYYVGKTTNIEFRLEDHINGIGSAWTIKYKYKSLLKSIKGCDPQDEDKYTLMYMELFGIDCVRGGSFCEIELNNDDKLIINKMINTANNNCYKCGKKGHFIKKCYTKDTCDRCGRTNHNANNCYAKTNISGEVINTIVCTRCGRNSHDITTCYAKTHFNKSLIF